eukprot:367965-Alexandrium_andersonii.AAC.1
MSASLVGSEMCIRDSSTVLGSRSGDSASRERVEVEAGGVAGGYEDACVTNSDAPPRARPDGRGPWGAGGQEGPPCRDAAAGAALAPEL